MTSYAIFRVLVASGNLSAENKFNIVFLDICVNIRSLRSLSIPISRIDTYYFLPQIYFFNFDPGLCLTQIFRFEVDSFHATPIGIMLNAEKIAWDCPPPSPPRPRCRRPCIQLLNSDSNGDMRDLILIRLIGIADFHGRLNSDSTHLSQSRVKFKNKVQLNPRPTGEFYNAPTGGGAISSPPPLISEANGPILKIQAAFESRGKTV